MFFSRNHGPSRFMEELDVFLRRANLDDADQLIALNKAFRAEMMQWEVGMGRSSPVYPVLDMEDLHYILNEEESSNLIVLGRKEAAVEKLLGYSYAYLEPWGSESNRKSRKQNGRRGGSHSCASHSGKTSRSDESEDQKSLYIAELFVVESERGLGFGELLLCETLRENSSLSTATRSHLYVSSRNISAVKCYGKFGYIRSQKSSGDDVHDLVMELDNAQRSAYESAIRLDRRIEEGAVGERRRRSRSSPVPAMPDGPSSPTPHHHHHSPCSHRHTPEPSGSPHHSPSLHHRGGPTQFTKKDDAVYSGARPLKNYSAGCKRKSKAVEIKKVSGSVEGDFELDVGDLHDSTLRHHGGYERKNLESSIDSLPVDALTSAFDGTRSLNGHRRKKREISGQHVESEVGSFNAGKKRGDMLPKSSANCVKQSEISRISLSPALGGTRFLLTGFPRLSWQQRTENAIRSLGGDVSSAEEFDPSCTHVICPIPVRTEKFMCAMAAGKLLIHSTYIDESAQSGYFLPHENFKWNSIASSSKGIEKLPLPAQELAHALIFWNKCRPSQERPSSSSHEPKRRTRSVAVDDCSLGRVHSCFSGISVVLVVSNVVKDGMRRLLSAGGANLCVDFREPYCGNGAQRFTHALVSPDLFDNDLDPAELWGGESVRQQALQRFRELHRDGVRCVRADFLLDFLAKGPSLGADAYVLRLSAIKSHTSNRKRKRESSEQRWSFFEAEPFRTKKRIASD